MEYAGTDLFKMSLKNNKWPELFDPMIVNLEEGIIYAQPPKQTNYALENSYEKQIGRVGELIKSL